MNRSVLFGTILLLLLTAVPAMPTAAAWEPCVKDDCVVVARGDDWACAGMRVDWEVYGACAEADPACAATRSGRVYEEYCVPSQPSLTPVSDVCVGVAPEVGGPVACVDRHTACVSAQSASLRPEVCARELIDTLLP